MATNYERGRRLEYRTLEIVRGMEDCVYATRTPGSKSHADIVAIFRDRKTGKPRPILIQCKYGVAKIDEAELDFLFAMRDIGLGALVSYKPRGSKQIYFWDLEEAVKKMIIVRARGTNKTRRDRDPFKSSTWKKTDTEAT